MTLWNVDRGVSCDGESRRHTTVKKHDEITISRPSSFATHVYDHWPRIMWRPSFGMQPMDISLDLAFMCGRSACAEVLELFDRFVERWQVGVFCRGRRVLSSACGHVSAQKLDEIIFAFAPATVFVWWLW